MEIWNFGEVRFYLFDKVLRFSSSVESCSHSFLASAVSRKNFICFLLVVQYSFSHDLSRNLILTLDHALALSHTPKHTHTHKSMRYWTVSLTHTWITFALSLSYSHALILSLPLTHAHTRSHTLTHTMPRNLLSFSTYSVF